MMFDPPENLETQRLLLRRPDLADAAEIFKNWTQDPEVTRYLVWAPHQRLEDAVAHLERCMTHSKQRAEFVWLIEEQDTGRLVGSIASRPGAHGVNVGYLLARQFWGRGFMVEVLEAVTSWWLAQPSVFRVWATCDIENGRSARALEKAGFSLEGTLRRWDVHPNLGPDPRDALCYSRVR